MLLFKNLFNKKTIFNEKMEEAIDAIKQFHWFEKCTVPYTAHHYYDYIQEYSLCKVEKQLNRVLNYNNFVCLRNLYIEASYRQINYLMREYSSPNEGYREAMKTLDAINKRLFNKNNEIDFDYISNSFISKYKMSIPLENIEIQRLVRELLFELYFIDKKKDFPIFFSHIIEIYRQGHIVIGWHGKFGTHDINLIQRPVSAIMPIDGKLIIF